MSKDRVDHTKMIERIMAKSPNIPRLENVALTNGFICSHCSKAFKTESTFKQHKKGKGKCVGKNTRMIPNEIIRISTFGFFGIVAEKVESGLSDAERALFKRMTQWHGITSDEDSPIKQGTSIHLALIGMCIKWDMKNNAKFHKSRL